MAVITINHVPYADNPELWNALLYADPLQFVLGFPLDQAYGRAYSPQSDYRDLSLIAMAKGQPVVGLQITAHHEGQGEKIGFYGRPALLRVHHGASVENRAKAEKALAEKLMETLQAQKYSLDYLDTCVDGKVSEFGVSLLKSGCNGMPVYRQIIDLRESEDTLRRDIRKSYRSLISWGEKNLSISVYDQKNATQNIVDDFHLLHVAVAGRETRPPETWNLVYQQLKENQAFLITGKLNDQLVTAAFFSHTPLYCCYGVSASIREMFDKPLSHALLWRSVIEARKRGCLLYDIGELADLYSSGYSEKERNIAVFKRGFGGTSRLQLKITTA